MREAILAKALRCIDEAYPDAESITEGYFPLSDFIAEAVRWVIDNAPTHLLTKRITIDAEFSNEDGVLTAVFKPEETLGEDRGYRIVYVKCDDWHRPVLDIISEQNPLYRQQNNKVLRGNPTRPIVVQVGTKETGNEESLKLELYTTDNDYATIMAVPYWEECIPIDLVDITAWKLAEIVLVASSDVQAASVCTAKVNEHLQQLSL